MRSMMKFSYSFGCVVTAGALVACNAVLDNREAVLDEEDGGQALTLDGSLVDASSASVLDGAHDGGAPNEADVLEAGPDASDGATIDAGVVCGPGEKACFGDCVSINEPLFGCGPTTCAPCSLSRAKAVCAGGACAIGSCSPGYADCNQKPSDGCETDLSQPTHCGTCNAACSSVAPLCTPSSTGFSCVNGCQAQAPTLCGNQCVNLLVSVNHCGQCGNACPTVANGQVACTTGHCQTTCNAGFHACGSACVSNMDPATCGKSCTPCAAPAQSVPTCAANKCGFVCLPGFHKCGDSCVSDDAVASCGDACSPCKPPVNAIATCTNQTCGFTCAAGFHACGTGCVSDGSVATCGTSCTPCPNADHAAAICTAQGTCGLSCAPGFSDCDANPINGCEAELGKDPNHCGTCTNVCPGTACSGGVCLPPPADAGAD